TLADLARHTAATIGPVSRVAMADFIDPCIGATLNETVPLAALSLPQYRSRCHKMLRFPALPNPTPCRVPAMWYLDTIWLISFRYRKGAAHPAPGRPVAVATLLAVPRQYARKAIPTSRSVRSSHGTCRRLWRMLYRLQLRSPLAEIL